MQYIALKMQYQLTVTQIKFIISTSGALSFEELRGPPPDRVYMVWLRETLCNDEKPVQYNGNCKEHGNERTFIL